MDIEENDVDDEVLLGVSRERRRFFLEFNFFIKFNFKYIDIFNKECINKFSKSIVEKLEFFLGLKIGEL